MGGQHRHRLQVLLRAYIDDTINDTELKELAQLVKDTEDNSTLAEAIDTAWHELTPKKDLVLPSSNLYHRILADHRVTGFSSGPSVHRNRNLWPALTGIAAFICLAIFLYIQQHTDDKKNLRPKIAAKVTQQKPILPGNKKAILTLANGKQIALDTLAAATYTQRGTHIKKEAGKLVYVNRDHSASDDPINQNTVSTPRGGEFELVLPDGTKVWLNAKSSLTYPTRFCQAQRKVVLLGEAYFDVADNPRQPFVVEANGTAINVLGTEFNVTAYQEENTIKTTLIAGAIQVKTKKLKPGQQALTFPVSEKVKIREVDVQEATAWKRGYFYFADENLKTVMQTIARWYDIEVEYQGNLQSKTFGGTISRYEDFQKLLNVIALTGSVHFEIKGRRVIVSP